MNKLPMFQAGSWGFALLVLASLFTGCGQGQDPAQGTYHPAGWLAIHPGQALADLDHCQSCHSMTVLRVGSSVPNCMTAACHHGTLPTFSDPASHGLRAKALQDATGGGLVSCQACHGRDFSGGGSGNACQTCHLVPAPHPPKPWLDAAGYTHATTDPSNAVVCAQCHLAGSPFNPPGAASSPPGPGVVPTCFNATLCHGASPASHPVPYLGDGHTSATPATFASTCSGCHAVTGTSPNAGAPLCSVCHQAGSPLTVTACASCHEQPPAGTAFPDLAGVHAKHNALANVTGQCSTCHSGFETGTLAHYQHADARPGADGLRVSPAPAAFLATYNAKAGAATFAPATLTCSNVSCHGALPTPNWQTGSGTLDSTGATGDTGCRLCHAQGSAVGVPENNSYYSGRHSEHLGNDIHALCTDCHGMANGTPGALAHFAHLDTPQMEGPASDTIQYGGSRAVYNAANRTCTLTCHGENHNNNPW